MSSYLDKTGLERVWSKATDKFATIATTDELKGNIETLTSTKADKTEVETAVAGLVDSAPETLNTLNELAAALGDDPNFATTISTQIGEKVNTSTYNDGIAALNNRINGITPANIGAAISGNEYAASLDTLLQTGIYRVSNQNGVRHNYGQVIVCRGGNTSDTIAQISIPYDHSGLPSIRYGNPATVGGKGDWLGWYDFLTTKAAVTIAQGGTGATDAATARANLGITPANIGALPITGGTVTGTFYVLRNEDNYAYIDVKNVIDGVTYVGGFTIGTDGALFLRLVAGSTTLNSMQLTSATTNFAKPVTVRSGGTGATDAATARTNLGITPANIGAAPTSHASTATTYGAASASNYGHAMASSTTPKANGTAAVGSETAKFARGDHVHPLQTSVSGSAGSVAWTGVSGKPSYYDAKAIKGITRSGTTFTYTCMDGTTGTFTQQDNNTTYSAGNGLSLSSTTFSVSYGTSASALGTSSAGSATTVSRSDHVHALPALTSCTGTLTAAKGGTGLTASPSMLVNLGSTSAANVLQASPRPGITGTLGIGNGGTGATSKSGARTNLGITSGTSLPSSASAGDIFFLYT